MPLAENHIMAKPLARTTRKFDEHYAPIVPEIRRLLLLGYSQPEVAELLNKQGLRNTRGGLFKQPKISQLVALYQIRRW